MRNSDQNNEYVLFDNPSQELNLFFSGSGPRCRSTNICREITGTRWRNSLLLIVNHDVDFAFLESLLTKIEHCRVTVIGFSKGGETALLWIREHAADSLVLLDPVVPDFVDYTSLPQRTSFIYGSEYMAQWFDQPHRSGSSPWRGLHDFLGEKRTQKIHKGPDFKDHMEFFSEYFKE